MIGLSPVHPKDIETYFINKNYDFRNPLCQTCPDIECLFAEGSFRIPEETTICVRSSKYTDFFFINYSLKCRSKPKSNINAKEDWSSVFGFGVMAKDKQVLDEVNI